MEYLLLVFALVFGLFLRMMFGALEATDEWVSFWHIRRLHGQPWLYYGVPDSAIEGTFSYPVLPHYLISRMPPRLWGIVGRILNAAYDLPPAVIVYFLTDTIARHQGLTGSIGGLTPALASTLLFLTLPVLLPARVRMKTIKGRSMGLTVVTLYFAATIAVMQSHSFVLGGVAVLLGVLNILTSLFSQQVMVFFSLLLGLLSFSFVPPLLAATSMLVAWIVPPFGAREPLRFMWHHKLWYFRNYHKGTTAANRNSLRELMMLPVTLLRAPQRAIFYLFYKFTPFIAVYTAPLAATVLVFAVLGSPGWSAALSGTWAIQSWNLTLASFVLFAMTSLPVLSAFGEAERYLEYSAPWYVSLFTLALVHYGAVATPVFWLVLLAQLIAVAFNFLLAARNALVQSEPYVPPGLRRCVEWAGTNLERASIATVPVKLAFLASNVRNQKGLTTLTFYYRMLLRKNERAMHYMSVDLGGTVMRDGVPQESFEMPRMRPSDMVARYGLTHLLVDDSTLDGLRATWPGDDAKLLDAPVFEAGGFRLCELPVSSPR